MTSARKQSSAHPKLCPSCGKQGGCHDSRRVSDYVRRRYHCTKAGCDMTWTTAEFFIEAGDSKDKWKVRHHRERLAKEAARGLLAKLQLELSS